MKHGWEVFMNSKRIHILATCAILLAMGTVLSLIPIFEMPLGGTLTPLSMLPICLVGIIYGKRWGFGTAFVYSVIQLIVSKCFAWGLTPLVLIVCILADYIIAFTALGVTSFFRGGKGKMLCGITVAMILRMACHYISGVTIWASSAPEGWNPWVYSLAYNGAFMLPETVFTLIGAYILLSLPQFKKLIYGNV